MVKSDKCFILSKSILLVVLLLLAGCTPVISRQVREQVRPDITFKEILNAPERYQGQMVILGELLSMPKIQKKGHCLRYYKVLLGSEGEPKDTDKSEGRFLVHNDSYLDLNIYTKGRICYRCRTDSGEESAAFRRNGVHLSTDTRERNISLADSQKASSL